MNFLSFCDLRICLGISNKDVFDSYIGAYSGLSYQINKCKVSVGYPDKGIPILFMEKKGRENISWQNWWENMH